MKKRKRIIAMLLGLAMVFGLCGSEVIVHTVMAQEEVEDGSHGQEVQKETENESQESEKSFENVSGKEIMENLGQEKNMEKNPQEASEAEKTETTQLAEENETEISEDTKQLQEQEEEAQIKGTAEQPENIIEKQGIAQLSTSDLDNPRIEKDSGMMAGQKVTWDCIWFGKYPQAEVVPSADSYTAANKSILKNGDIIENSSLYNKLRSATGWNANNDIMVDGNTYRRMKESDATDINPGNDDSNYYYNWSDSDTYHYFKYESIKWRVLKVDGNQAFLLSDLVLDGQKYNTESEIITWETSTIRSWLNGYGASSNKQGNDYTGKNFIGSALSSNERSAIVNTAVVNADNSYYKTDGGNNTTDKIFLLSESETSGDSAKAHGFVSSSEDTIYDEAGRSKSSTYAKAMGVGSNIEYGGNSSWWLRSPGLYGTLAAYVGYGGYTSDYGKEIDYSDDHIGVRIALNLNLSPNLHIYAGTVCSDGTMQEENRGCTEDSGNGGNNGENGTSKNPPTVKKAPVKVSKIKLSGISKKIAAGKKIKLAASIKPSNAANKKLTWKSSNKKVATVNSKGVVTMNKKSGGKSVTITATAKDGSKVKAAYKITSMKGVVKKVAVSGKKTIKAGGTLKLKAKVTATKKANKKLKWSSSNKKYATVSSSGKVKALKTGKGKKVKITAMATDGSGKKKTVTIKIK